MRILEFVFYFLIYFNEFCGYFLLGVLGVEAESLDGFNMIVFVYFCMRVWIILQVFVHFFGF